MLEPVWLQEARKLVGLREIVGSQHEKKVLDFFVEAGHPEIHNDETAWCAAFANAMLRRAGQAGTGSLMARSFLTWGTKLDAPRVGCIAVFPRGNSKSQGHVGFVVAVRGNTIDVLAGNQGNAVSIVPFLISSALGFRWPLIKSAGVPKPAVPEVKPELIKARRFEAITATVFATREAEPEGAYGVFDPRKPGVALPFRFKGAARPRVRVFYNGKSVDCDVVDVGPWNIDDQYWTTASGRPRAEAQNRDGVRDFVGRVPTNDAGIDLTPGAAAALGLVGKGKVAWQFIDAKAAKSTDGETAGGAVIATTTTAAIAGAWSTGDYLMLAFVIACVVALAAGFVLWIYRKRNGRFPWQREAPTVPAPELPQAFKNAYDLPGTVPPSIEVVRDATGDPASVPIGSAPIDARLADALAPAEEPRALPGFLAQAAAERGVLLESVGGFLGGSGGPDIAPESIKRIEAVLDRAAERTVRAATGKRKRAPARKALSRPKKRTTGQRRAKAGVAR